jgi:hypothetical protein
MRGMKPLPRSRSSCLASQKALQPRSGWRRLDPVLTAVRVLLLGQACFSEWSLMASFPGCPSIPSPSACFALHPAVSAISHGFHFKRWITFTHQIRISSATASLRNSWDLQERSGRIRSQRSPDDQCPATRGQRAHHAAGTRAFRACEGVGDPQSALHP